MESSQAAATSVPAIALPRLPILDDPEVRQALAKLRDVLEIMAAEFAPVVARARELPEVAKLLSISSAEEHDFVREWLASDVSAVAEDAKRIVDPYATMAHRVHRSLTALRSLALEPCEEARQLVAPKILAWDRHVEAERRRIEEENRRAREAAEKLAAIHRAVYMGAVGVSQVAELAVAQEEKLQAAAAAEQAGDKAAAEAMLEEAGRVDEPTIQPHVAEVVPLVVPEIVAPERPKGVAKNWKARLKDRRSLIRFIAQHPEYENLLDLNQSVADKLAKALEEKLGATVAGLEAYNDPTVRIARRR